LILFVFLTIFSFRATEWMPATGLLPSGLVAAFLSFKTLSALYSQVRCNKLANNSLTYTAPPELVGAINIIIAVILSAYSSITIGQGFDTDGRFWGPSSATAPSASADRDMPLVDVDGVAPNHMHLDVECESSNGEEPLSGPIGYNVAAFHAAIAFSMCYIAMQLTNWNQEFSPKELDKGVASMWIKIVDSWILALAFGWSMVAPVVLKSRQFS